VSQKSADISRRFVFANGEDNQTVAGMTAYTLVKAWIASEEGSQGLLMEQREDLFDIIHPLARLSLPI
jgi:hypothetical protein